MIDDEPISTFPDKCDKCHVDADCKGEERECICKDGFEGDGIEKCEGKGSSTYYVTLI